MSTPAAGTAPTGNYFRDTRPVEPDEPRVLYQVEEHVAHGGVGQMVATSLLADGHSPGRFASRTALGYVSGRYGSQRFHRRECGLDPASIVIFIASSSWMRLNIWSDSSSPRFRRRVGASTTPPAVVYS